MFWFQLSSPRIFLIRLWYKANFNIGPWWKSYFGARLVIFHNSYWISNWLTSSCLTMRKNIFTCRKLIYFLAQYYWLVYELLVLSFLTLFWFIITTFSMNIEYGYLQTDLSLYFEQSDNCNSKEKRQEKRLHYVNTVPTL